jgi:hypothetical protein
MDRNTFHKYREQVIDHTPKSGAGTNSDGSIDASNYQFHVTEDETTWSESDQSDERVERFGREWKKWDWLKRLNRTEGHNERYSENTYLHRAKDLRVLTDLTSIPDEKLREWLHEECQNILKSLHESNKGFHHGKFTVEQIEIGIVTVAARRLVTRRVDSFDDLDERKPLHSLAMDGKEVQTLRDEWLSDDPPPTKQTRKVIQDHL